jgi:hypothetical protein
MKMPGMTAEFGLTELHQEFGVAAVARKQLPPGIVPQEYIVNEPDFCDLYPDDIRCAGPPIVPDNPGGGPPTSGGIGPGLGGSAGAGGAAHYLPPDCKEYQDTSKDDSCYLPPNIPVYTAKCYTPIPAPGKAPQTVCPNANGQSNTYWKWTPEAGGCSVWNYLSRCSSS